MHVYDLQERTIGHILADKARKLGDKPLLLWQGRRYGYAEAEQLTNRYADGFRLLGIRHGDHVAVMLPNCPEFLWAVWGLGKLGAVAVPINTAAKGELLQYFLSQSDSAWVVVDEEWAGRIAEVAPRLTGIKGFLHHGTGPGAAILGALGPPVTDLREMERGSPEPQPPGLVRHTDLHFIMYTSGTTGPSKATAFTQSTCGGDLALIPCDRCGFGWGFVGQSRRCAW